MTDRNINEILLDIQKGHWLDNREEGIALAREYCKAYDNWLKTGKPTPYLIARLKGVTRNLFRHVVVWEMFPDYKGY